MPSFPLPSSSAAAACPLAQPSSRSRLVRAAVLESGASASVADLVASSRRPLTERLYGHKWSVWSDWCSSQGLQATDPSPSNLADFLVWLSNSKKLAVSTIKGYRSAISTTVRQLGGRDLSEDQLLGDVSRALSLQEARAPRRVPAWDLFLVLAALRKPPFEPLADSAFKWLTYKTVFLLALATARRRSEIHGLSGDKQDIAFNPDGSVSLRFLPEFLAKTQDPSSSLPSVTVRSLSDILARDDEDRKLCPVRALSYYLARSNPRRKNQRRLFISLNEEYSRDIAAGTVSRWISATIVQAYQSSAQSMSALNPRAHEVRALATSAAFQQSVALHQVLAAAFWRSENPFINHYLRDLRSRRLDGSFTVSFVAAQEVLASSSH